MPKKKENWILDLVSLTTGTVIGLVIENNLALLRNEEWGLGWGFTTSQKQKDESSPSQQQQQQQQQQPTPSHKTPSTHPSSNQQPSPPPHQPTQQHVTHPPSPSTTTQPHPSTSTTSPSPHLSVTQQPSPSTTRQHPSTVSQPQHPSITSPPQRSTNQPQHPSIPSTHGAPYPPGGRLEQHKDLHPPDKTTVEKQIVAKGIEAELTPKQTSQIPNPAIKKQVQQMSPVEKANKEAARDVLEHGVNVQPHYKPAINDPDVKKIAQRYNTTPKAIVSKLTGSPETAAQIEKSTAEPHILPGIHGSHGGHSWVESDYPHKAADGMVTHLQVKDDYGPNILPKGTTSIFSVGYISHTGYPERVTRKTTTIQPGGNETEIIYLSTGGGKQRDIDTNDPDFIKAVNNSGGNMADQPIVDGIYATVDGKPVYKHKIPIVKGHDYTNIIRDLGNNKGTLYQVIDNTSGQQDGFIDHSLKGKTSGPTKQILN